MRSNGVFLVCGCVLLVITLILHTICLAMPYYAEAENIGVHLSNKSDLRTYIAFYPNMDARYGYWKLCVDRYGDTACYNFAMDEDINSSTMQAPDWVIACQALSIAGLAVGALGVVFPLVWLCVSSTALLVAGSSSAIIGGILIIVANIVFAVEKSITFAFKSTPVTNTFGHQEYKYIEATNSSFNYGWGFGLDIATGATSILIGVLYALCAAMIKSDRLYISKGGMK